MGATKYHFQRDQVNKEKLADLLTKSLTATKFLELRSNNLGLKTQENLNWGGVWWFVIQL